jgi:hypothetical protein
MRELVEDDPLGRYRQEEKMTRTWGKLEIRKGNSVRKYFIDGVKREELLPFMRKVLRNEGTPNLTMITRNPGRGGTASVNFMGTTIEFSDKSSFLHELSHTQVYDGYCEHSGKTRRLTCECSHSVEFHVNLFKMYARYLSKDEAATARRSEYRYHPVNSGKAARKVRKFAEYRQWKASRRENRKQEVADISQENRDAAAKFNREAAQDAWNRMAERNDWSRAYRINWYGPNSISWTTEKVWYDNDKKDWVREPLAEPIAHAWGRGTTAKVYPNGEVRLITGKVVMRLEVPR